jgi:hypothetical protein
MPFHVGRSADQGDVVQVDDLALTVRDCLTHLGDGAPEFLPSR